MMVILVASSARAAEEPRASQVRPYLHWRVGEFAPAWGVLDLRGISFGAQVDPYWSFELALDVWQLDLQPAGDRLGEQQIASLFPQARLGVPLWKNRVYVYSVAGIGGTWIQFNDRKVDGIPHTIDADGMAFAATAGGGIDFFLADNIAFNLEARYVWAKPMGVHISDQRYQWNASSLLATLGLRIYFDKHPTEALLRPASATSPVRLFFGTQGGVTYLTDRSWVEGARIIPKLNALGEELNLTYNLSLGADFGRHLGLELSMVHTEYSLDLPEVGPVAEYSSYSVIPMLRLRFPSESGRWVPYLVAGVGAMYSEKNDTKPAGQGMGVDAKGLAPAMAVGGGIEYFLARNLSFNFETRWRYAWDQKIKVIDGPTGKGDHSEVQFNVGFRAYLFESGRRR